MKVAIIGYSIEGKVAADYWKNLGHEICIHDQNQDLEIPDGLASHLGPNYLAGLDAYDLVVRSPGTHPHRLFEASPNLDSAKVTSTTNEFLANCPARVIGVTGTKGKGTTSSLIAAILEAAGHTVHLGGNIGISPLSFLNDVDANDWVVLEMSSFQLMDARHSPHVAIMLMMASDHQEWHANMSEYLKAKQNIFKFQQAGDRAIFNACNIYSLQSGLAAPGDQVGYNSKDGAWVDDNAIKIGDKKICDTSDIGLVGAHNRDNVCAAVTAVWPIVQDEEIIKQAIKGFKGLNHRLEHVGEANGVNYYDDSISTNPETAIGAINAFAEPKVIILGGSDKGAEFRRLAREISRSNIRAAILIGQTSPEIKRALDDAGYQNVVLGTGSMADIVQLAAKQAQPGDAVLLSPACASFDMFSSYKDRGDQFSQAVKSLVERG